MPLGGASNIPAETGEPTVRGSRALLAAIIIAAAPKAGAAQFTAAVLPAAGTLERLSAAGPDTSRGANALRGNTMTPAASWLDSAMGDLALDSSASRSSSVALTESLARPVSRTTAPRSAAAGAERGDTVFRNGAFPPETDSRAPLLALAGVGTLLIGVALLRR